MCRFLIRQFFLIIAIARLPCLAQPNNQPEYRAVWVDAWHAGYENAEQVDQLLRDVRRAKLNTIFLQVRKRGDAYYRNSPYEPSAPCVTGEFDPLAEVIRKAHDTNLGPRIEVHGWFVVYPILTITTPGDFSPVARARANPKNPFTAHQDWLDQSESGAVFDGDHYGLDPGHPAVQDYLFKIAMDIISRYDLDGFQLDHIRYPGSKWGYNPNSVSRFNALTGREGKPIPEDPQWKQFRRDQVTALVRKLYLSSLSVKANLKFSAATVTWLPAVKTEQQWLGCAAYNDVAQDWVSWMREGILDVNVPMIFFRQTTAINRKSYVDWVNFANQHCFGRHIVVGQAAYLNSIEGTAAQLNTLRSSPGVQIGIANGIAFYSYATSTRGQEQRLEFWNLLGQLTNAPVRANLTFAEPVPTPNMQWKAQPKAGHLKGLIRRSGLIVDGANVTLTSSTGGTSNVRTDATGFYGFVNQIPGKYTLEISIGGKLLKSVPVVFKVGSRVDLNVDL
jgi:uncharacterized lipoprotein YddW (UPF0748 family)